MMTLPQMKTLWRLHLQKLPTHPEEIMHMLRLSNRAFTIQIP